MALVPRCRGGQQPELSGDLDADQPPYDPKTVVFTTDERSSDIITFYRDQCAQSEAVLATTPLSAPLLAGTGWVATSLRTFVGSCCT